MNLDPEIYRNVIKKSDVMLKDLETFFITCVLRGRMNIEKRVQKGTLLVPVSNFKWKKGAHLWVLEKMVEQYP